MVQEFKSKILKIIQEAPEVKTLVIECPDDFSFQPGQFVMLSLPDNPKFAKAYSISSSPLKKRVIEITFKIESYPKEEEPKHLTPRLGKCKPGQELIIKGSYGKFILGESKSSYIFISAGTGIAPLMSMIRYCLDKSLKKDITLINSNRTPEAIIYKKELQELSSKINLIQTITQPQSEWKGHKGRIDKHLLRENLKPGALIYICGPKEMVLTTKQYLKDLSIADEQIRVELWG